MPSLSLSSNSVNECYLELTLAHELPKMPMSCAFFSQIQSFPIFSHGPGQTRIKGAHVVGFVAQIRGENRGRSERAVHDKAGCQRQNRSERVLGRGRRAVRLQLELVGACARQRYGRECRMCGRASRLQHEQASIFFPAGVHTKAMELVQSSISSLQALARRLSNE